MRIKKRRIKYFILLIVVVTLVFHPPTQGFSVYRARSNTKGNLHDLDTLFTSTVDNSGIIDSIFDTKIQDYDNHSYYSQIYESSLQATYYALYILNTLGKLHTINKTAIINFVLSHYESSSNRFMDSLSYRYLNIDVSRDWSYPFSSTLETTCYATLSLELLDSLDLIDTQDIIDYIWSCYNTDTSGFIGQPYESTLPTIFKISTMDNTFFAVITLDLLISDWLMYLNQKNNIIQFINDLQIGEGSWQTGGFFNDYYPDFDSLSPLFEPNLLSSFYSIKTLEVFGMEDIINRLDFHQFLNNSYDSLLNYFHIAPWEYIENYGNIVATSLGLILSDITEFTDINRVEVINFILSNRNSFGCWDQSTTITHHELIDTFQIIRSLENSQVISQLTLEERNQIGNATQFYYQMNGYSLLSEDYTSMNLVNTIVRSFELYGKLADINIQEIYAQITTSFTENYQVMFTNSFIGYLAKTDIMAGFRSYPIEYYSNNNKLRSHKSTYYALDSLSRMFKLDDFLFEIDGNELISDIVATQFLNDSYYDTYGAFSPLWPYNSYYQSTFLNSNIRFEYSYYAIKCLELLAYQLGLGNITSLGVDTMALYNYIERNIIETPTELYFDPSYTSNIEVILEYTYYMIYILKTLNMYGKDSQKIITYVEANLDYENIKNVYFSYKISEILNIDIEFDRELTQQLVQKIYSEQYNEFYCTSNREVITYESFYWICEMARNSKIGIEASYSSIVDLGSYNHIEVSLDNLILHDFGTYLTFKFESNQLGAHLFSEQPDGNHVADILIPFDPVYYPLIGGYLRAYEGSLVRAEQYISFDTTYTLEYNLTIQNEINALQFYLNTSIVCNKTRHSLDSGSAFTEIYVNDTYIEAKSFSHQSFIEYSFFNLNFSIMNDTEYLFQIFLNDGISNQTHFLEEAIFNITSFETTYTLEHNLAFQMGVNTVHFSLNTSLLYSNGTRYSLESGYTFTDIYINDTFIEMKNFSRQDFTEYNIFSLDYEILNDTKYLFQVFLNDGISNITNLIEELIFNTSASEIPEDSEPDPDPDPDPEEPDDPDIPNTAVKYDKEIQMAIPLIIIFLATPGVAIFSSRKLKKIQDLKT
ncbi:MAG: hypothetical protein HWN81_02865 [Candidatus Lokiarchaeota archaeon]|nr:hypothetical protein [Candidatus Lokiarchaeota archaeon]